MKKFILIMCFVSLIINGYSQNIINIDTVIYKSINGNTTVNNEFIYVYDSIKIHQIRERTHQKDSSFVFFNDLPIDSSGLEIEYPLFYNNSFLFLTESDKPNFSKRLVKYSLNENSFENVNYINKVFERDSLHIDISYNYYYNRYKSEEGIFLYKYDPIEKKEEFIVDFSEYNNFTSEDGYTGSYNYSGIVDVWVQTPQKIFIKLGLFQTNIGDYSKFEYYFVENGEKSNITEKVISAKFKEILSIWTQSKINMISNDNEYFREYFRVPNEISNKLRDNNYNFIQDLLFIGYHSLYYKGVIEEHPNLINGINMQNGRIVHYFVNSYIDYERRRRDAEVIIPYEFVPRLEIAMYNAYNNKLLSEKDIDGLSKHQLGILRNLLFAKHNYKFSSEFYQAYFNLFAFYNGDDKMKSRTKDINHLLTEADKANITLIRAAEERANGIED